MNTETGQGLMAEQAEQALYAALADGRLKSGQFLSMSQLVELLGFPLAAVREAAKVAAVQDLLTILPKRGVQVMDAGPEITRHCIDLRAILDQEGARRLIASGRALAVGPLRRAHEEILDAAGGEPSRALSRRAIQTDLSLHDFLAAGLDNPLARDTYASNRRRIAVIQNTRPFLHDRIEPALHEHLAIIDALEARDAAACVAAIRHHFVQTLQWWGVYA